MDDLIRSLGQCKEPLDIYGVRGGAVAWLVGRLGGLARPLLCVCPDDDQARQLATDLALFSDLPVVHYPDLEVAPYAALRPDPGSRAARLAALFAISDAASPFIMVAAGRALSARTLPPERLQALAELVIRGEECDAAELTGRLAAGGYERVALVQEVGEYSIRGGIIDIFPPGQEYPLRLDFFGDTVEEIRRFDPISQRSVGELAEAILLPASDCLYPAADSPAQQALLERHRQWAASLQWDRQPSRQLEECLRQHRPFAGDQFFLPLLEPAALSPLAYLPANTLIIQVDHPRLLQNLALHRERIASNYQELTATAQPALPPDELFLSAEQLHGHFEQAAGARIFPLAPGEANGQRVFQIEAGNHVLLKQQLDLKRREEGLLAPLAQQIKQWRQQGERVLLACRTPRHAAKMAELLAGHGVTDGDHCRILKQPLSSGFDLPSEGEHWLSEGELFGDRRLESAAAKSRAPATKIVSHDEINPGDPVVHRRHGIGIYRGLVPIELDGITNDYLEIHYRGADKLYIPVDQLNSVGKYKGLADQEPTLDKLGDNSWLATRQKVKKAVWQVARDLLKLYAKRQLAEGNRFSPPGEMYHELEESFPYDETPGQLKAIGEVIDDLCSSKPMDRLVCGDVGYGKTEVAVRAAFKVVEDGGQVAVLVPTTVLAEQHAATFRERLAGFPVRIDSLNRFRSSAEQKRLVADLAAAKIDIVIGTHRLLSADVKFRRLGLLIVDEEHRFGVSHKEKIKKLRSGVDVLTLTATPIPRTLQLSLLGVRDLSVISSPPRLRRAVKTFIARHDDLVIKEAIMRELGRDGQVFLVHNRVSSIHEVATRAQQLVPTAQVAVAHGQMPARQLEEIMVRFVRREINVLVCTTIIESGLDIPDANTIIITRADRLGLAEIYQLRGRVGRSRQQAYAYLLVPALDDLAGEARHRLQALMDYNELGGGFKLALSDLQIRGGGNILGESQSGNIAAVGYDMYLDLLQKTVLDLKRRLREGEETSSDPETMAEVGEEFEPEIKLAIAAHIPASYVDDVNQRYLCYRRITAAEDDATLADIRDEFGDRFGPLPPETANLFEIISLKNRLAELKISKIEQGPTALALFFAPSTPVPPERLTELVAQGKKGMRLTPEGKLIKPLPANPSPTVVFNEIKKLLHALRGNAISQ